MESPAVQLVRSLHEPGEDLVTLFGDDEVFERLRDGLAQVIAPDARMRADLAGMESLEDTGGTAAHPPFDDAHAAWERLSVGLDGLEPDGPQRWIATGRISARGLDSDTPVQMPARWRMGLRDGRLAEVVTEL